MIYQFKTLFLTTLIFTVSGLVQAQQSQSVALIGAAASAAAVSADYIVAVVNSEPITNVDVHRQAQLEQQLAQQSGATSTAKLNLIGALQSLINRKTQLQFARETGLSVEDSAIEQAEQAIALQNQLDVAQLHRRIESQGQSVSQFRHQLGEQIVLQRLHERDVEQRVQVSDQEIDQFLRDQAKTSSTGDTQINIAQILVAVPESATPAQLAALKERATRIWERARKGENFAALVHEYSQAADQDNDGQMGLRSSNRYPELFVSATAALVPGQVADLVRSPAGFHILKLVQKVHSNVSAMTLIQSHARHILLVPNAQMSKDQARQKLTEFKQQIEAGKADFAILARQNSQDGSAAQGGDLGWLSPGATVPEFETAMNQLAPGEISAPVSSRFGLHLIQMLERREVSLNVQQQREAARAALREKKLDSVYRAWAQDVLARAYIEMRQPPQ